MSITGLYPEPDDSGRHAFTTRSSEIHFNVKIRKLRSENFKM
jgi:hypothetical protein